MPCFFTFFPFLTTSINFSHTFAVLYSLSCVKKLSELSDGVLTLPCELLQHLLHAFEVRFSSMRNTLYFARWKTLFNRLHLTGAKCRRLVGVFEFQDPMQISVFLGSPHLFLKSVTMALSAFCRRKCIPKSSFRSIGCW